MDYIDRLTALREDNDKDQKEIAILLNCQQSAISKYEKKIRKYKVEDITKLCLYYGVSADYILGLPKGLKHPER